MKDVVVRATDLKELLQAVDQVFWHICLGPHSYSFDDLDHVAERLKEAKHRIEENCREV